MAADNSMHALDAQDENQKETYEAFATYAWISSGIVLLFLDEKFTLLSWQSLLFFIVGPFLAGVVLGWIFSCTQRGLEKVLTLFVSQPSSGAVVVRGLVGVVVTLLNAGIAFVVAQYAVTLMT